MTQLRSAGEADFPAILALNEDSVHFLSEMDASRLALLHSQSAWHRVALDDTGAVIAFLLAFREGSPYDSVNYRWFAQRYERFLYIDRVVVAASDRGRGVGEALYRDAFAHAASSGVPQVTCEFDIEPRNDASGRFHAKFGFQEVGRQAVPYAPKLVAMQAACVPTKSRGTC